MRIRILAVAAFIAASASLAGCGAEKHHDHDGHGHEENEKSEGHGDHGEKDGDHHGDEIIFTPEKAKAAGLTYEKVTAAPFNDVIKTSGEVLSARGDESAVVATSNGVVRFCNPDLTEGSPVKGGAALFSVSAKGMVDGDPADKARIEYETAKREYERCGSLVKDKIVSQKEYEQARMAYETARAAYIGVAQKSGGRGVTVTSPINGYVKNLLVRQGEYVETGQPMATVAQNRRLMLRAEVSERHFDKIKEITGANFKLPYSDRLYRMADLKGRLLSFGKASADNSFFIPVTFEFDNIGDIVPGSYAEVFLTGQSRGNVISVPVGALTEEQGLFYVYVRLDEEGYHKQEVTIGQSNGERTVITSGLKGGETVVTKGALQVKMASLGNAIPEGHNHNH